MPRLAPATRATRSGLDVAATTETIDIKAFDVNHSFGSSSEAHLAAHEAASSSDGVQRDGDNLVVTEGASLCGAGLELLRAQSIAQHLGGLLHQHRVGAVGGGTAAGHERRGVE